MPPEWKSRTMSARGKQLALKVVGDLLCHRAVRRPGKLRFMLPLSIGEVRVPARNAG